MKYLSLACILFSFAISACKETEKTNTTAPETEIDAEETPYMVHASNQAWVKAKEINERVSPPKSIVKSTEDGLKVAVHYSSPFVNGRTIWDSLVAYDKVWRTGANEATIIEFSHNVKIAETEIKAGAYSLFTIPTKSGFTVILNSVYDQWGHYDYDETKDILRFEADAIASPFAENLAFQLSETETEITVSFFWEERGFAFNVSAI